jgi:hypothetical protein
MEQIQNYGSVIIDLDGAANGNTTVTNTATYDQAFLGEPFSEARGKGRARRKKRKLERIKNRREVKTERRKIKSDRQEERIGRRAKRKSSRQEMRDSQQEARMNRRNKRAEEKESRNAEEDTQDSEEVTTPTDDTADSGNYASDTDDSGDYASDSEDSGDYADDSEDSGDYSEDFDGEDFDGDSADDFAGEQSNFVSELNGGTSTSPIVDTICMKIEWNNEMISRLMAAKNKMEAKGQDTSKVTTALGQKFDRVQQLEGKLENFAGADGRVNPKKKKAVQMARVRARKQRMIQVVPPKVIASLTAKGMTMPQIKEYWATKGSKMYFGNKGRIKKSRADGDAPNDEEAIDVSYWGQPAYDNDEANEVLVDLDNKTPKMNFSGVDGSTSNKKMWRTLLIGGIVGFTAIYFIRKYKLLK